ncbi:hypothetical protein [Neorhizobium sp. NCHU2750]|uniref:hypothetical protein n=1 Tax=Neorhizobium sp. NCHU2750 TaxID=1825976 RepID=UPI000E75603C|nr:hypothetical protein NCHU2750_32890 [Neorhizobium sp. NCHU2750]
MARPDYTEYEKRRAEHHETAWRFAATLNNIRNRHCRLRLCRRLQSCSGPMLPSEHQRGAIRAQQEIGLTGKACATLPLCMAATSAEHYASTRALSENLTELRSTRFKDYTSREFLDVLKRHMRIQHRRP